LIRYTLFIAVSVSILISGCSEKPDRKAAKEVRKSADQARAIISDSRTEARRIIQKSEIETSKAIKKAVNGGSKKDLATAVNISRQEYEKAEDLINKEFQKAKAKIEGSLRKNRNSGDSKATALMTSGNILFSQALHLKASLTTASLPIDSLVDNISNNVILIGDLSTIRTQREQLIKANQQEIQNFRNVLSDGMNGFSGLKEKRKIEEQKISAISRQMKALENRGEKARDAANKIERSAMEKLRSAESMSGDKKLALQNEAFDLRLSKKEYSKQLQATSDKLENLQGRIDILAAVVNKIVEDISSIEDKIETIESANASGKLDNDLNSINKASRKHLTAVKNNIKGIASSVDDYLAASDEIITLLDQAIEQYEKV
jgi:vacuolar-type H+-ATPase subunit H